MSAEFIDSNIFVYLFDETDPEKHSVSKALILKGISEQSGCISFQVVQETLNVMTRKFPALATPSDARQFLESVLIPLWNVMPTPTLYQRAIDVHARYKFGFYDALIVAAALEAGCSVLYSEDLQHAQSIEGMRIVNPFLG